MVPVGCFSRHRFEQEHNLLLPFVTLELDEGFSCIIVYRADAVMGALLAGRLDHHLLAFRAPQCA